MKIKYTIAPFALLSLLAIAVPSSAQIPGAPPPPGGGGLIPGAPPPPPTPGLPSPGGPPPPGRGGYIGPAGASPSGGPGGARNSLTGDSPAGGTAAELTAEQKLVRATEIEVIKAHLQTVRAEIAGFEQADPSASTEELQQRAAKLKALKSFAARLEANLAKLENPAPKAGGKGDKRDPLLGYGPIQAVGEPDAGETGAAWRLAWHPLPSDSGKEWLGLIYEHAVDVAEIRIHNINTTGALARITACVRASKDDRAQPDRVIWEDREPVEKTPAVRVIAVPPGVRANGIRLEFDTTRAKKWQMIDAVELVARDGSRQWAKAAEASSYYNPPD